MNAESQNLKSEDVSGWIFFDSDCRFCVATRRRWGPLFERRGYIWLPLQTPGTAQRLGLGEQQLMAEMWLQLADGRVLGGASAWIALMRKVWWLWPLGLLLALPGINSLAHNCYRWVAKNRQCLGGACSIHSHSKP